MLSERFSKELFDIGCSIFMLRQNDSTPESQCPISRNAITVRVFTSYGNYQQKELPLHSICLFGGAEGYIP